jgi:hypothetical protein
MTDRRTQLRTWLYSLSRFELQLRVKVARARNAYLRAAAKSYSENDGHHPAWLDERHRRRVAAELAEHYEKVIPYFGGTALKQIKSRRIQKKAADSIFQALMAQWVQREALRKAKMIAATDAGDVRGAIEDGIEEGLGTAEIARTIRRASSLTPHRAAVIARTETHAAATFGSVESVRQAEQELGVRMLKEWLPTLDDRTREDHAAMADYGPIPLDEKFEVGGSLMDRPGDPSAPPEQTINCRCALAYEEATD